jgi:hypothetical protein
MGSRQDAIAAVAKLQHRFRQRGWCCWPASRSIIGASSGEELYASASRLPMLAAPLLDDDAGE